MMRPFVTVNCAMTADGKIASVLRKQMRISSAEDLARVKELRKNSDAILVGIGTVLSDDPHLTVKGLSYEENPLRIVLDGRGRLPETARVLDDLAETLIVTCENCSKTWAGAEVLRTGRDKVNLTDLMEKLYDRGIRTLMVEGGGEVISSFFENGLVDKYCVFVGSMIIGGRTAPTPADGNGFEQPVNLKLVDYKILGNGLLLTYEPVNDL
ncbi:diaminohydroxyphosphoribosylaminopyrimidine reductase [Candidatus Methanomassiliicoccus intestinalis]|uniref:2,5-diamino-6-(ribosylamino)-4(3H)-pyrimidinone 5'-phosphate reductase n=1 Tax=Candidatus Methanomassiliicoccus intestinalis TaxID=1406512 RepID=A0A8J8PF93_9ARCH|nr:MAG: diaminohydroxyphosphoribosylaminopyrimidine reductase [Candidatus Methanomassiliicoccus intestinalis]TQS81658.1 MAG: diaminohydroxyphosphoribosylaminopyrimidine reductase [Candidatus Methanomassiliicoccus intestinalis]